MGAENHVMNLLWWR